MQDSLIRNGQLKPSQAMSDKALREALRRVKKAQKKN